MRDPLLNECADAQVYRVGRGTGRKVLVRQYSGWSRPYEWISQESAIAGHAALAKSRFWEGFQHLEAIRMLKRNCS